MILRKTSVDTGSFENDYEYLCYLKDEKVPYLTNIIFHSDKASKERSSIFRFDPLTEDRALPLEIIDVTSRVHYREERKNQISMPMIFFCIFSSLLCMRSYILNADVTKSQFF